MLLLQHVLDAEERIWLIHKSNYASEDIAVASSSFRNKLVINTLMTSNESKLEQTRQE